MTMSVRLYPGCAASQSSTMISGDSVSQRNVSKSNYCSWEASALIQILTATQSARDGAQKPHMALKLLVREYWYVRMISDYGGQQTAKSMFCVPAVAICAMQTRCLAGIRPGFPYPSLTGDM